MAGSVLISLAVGLAGIVAVIWVANLALLIVSVRTREVLDSRSYPQGQQAHPKVSVIVAARNEENDIETCVRSLLWQDYPHLEIIVVDDRSTDRTPAILEKLAQSSGGRMSTFSVSHLPEGWFGKPHALHSAVQQAEGDVFVFTDADCLFSSRRAISVAVSDALIHESDLLTITPRFHSMSIVDRLVIPEVTHALIAWFLPQQVNRPDSKTAYANGAFMLMTRECYERTGGFAAVRSELTEDFALATRTKSVERRLRVAGNDDLYQAGAYGTLRRSWAGWTRILSGSLDVKKLVAMVTGFLLCEILPPVGLIMSLLLPEAFGGYSGLVAVLCGVSVGLSHVVSGAFMRLSGVPALYALGHLPGVSVAMGIAVNALLNHLGLSKTYWRGAAYAGNQLVPESESAQPVAGAAQPVADPAQPVATQESGANLPITIG